MEYEKDIDKHNIYEGQTTYRNDYRYFVNISRTHQTLLKEKVEKGRPVKPLHVKDFETLNNFQDDVHVDFTLWHKPKPILRTNPRSGFVIPEKPVDTEKEEVIKSRPRLYMSPAVSIDDVPDPKMRQLLCQYMYTTTWRKSEQEAAGPITKREVPNTTFEDTQNLVSLKIPAADPHPPPDWREQTIAWDEEQTRSTVDPTCKFWLTKDPPVRCGACEDPCKDLVSKDVKQEIDYLIRNDELRLPHDVTWPSYTGYKPLNTHGCSFRKTHLPIVHPALSVGETIATRFTDPDIPLAQEVDKKEINQNC